MVSCLSAEEIGKNERENEDIKKVRQGQEDRDRSLRSP